MLRVANIIEDGRLAGPQLRILAVAYELYKRGIETTVVFPDVDSEAFASRLDKSGIRSVALPLRRLSRGWWKGIRYAIYFPFEIFSLWRFFRKQGFAFIHCSGGFWQIKGLVAAKLAGIPAIWHMNDTVFPIRWRPLFLLACQLFVHRLIFAGRRVHEHYIGTSPCPVDYTEIQAPVNVSVFDPALAKVDARISSVEGIRVVTVANVNPLKGIEYFIEMAATLNSKYANLHFFVIGPIYDSQSAYYQKLTALSSQLGLENLTFLGASQDISSVLKAADVYVCTSISEASPTSVWEAMAMEKAIVSTDVGDASRFVIDDMSGLIVPPRDSKALAAAVSRLIDDSELRARYGTLARRIAAEQLAIDACVDGHIRAYQ